MPCPFHIFIMGFQWKKVFKLPKTTYRNIEIDINVYFCQQTRQLKKSFLQLIIWKSVMMLLFFRLYLVTKCSTHTIFLSNFLVLKCAPVRHWMSFVRMPCLPLLELTIKTLTWFVCPEISIMIILSNTIDSLSYNHLRMVLY